MAKTKQKKKKNNQNTVDSEILRYVTALAAITVTLIAALQLGIVGQFLTTITGICSERITESSTGYVYSGDWLSCLDRSFPFSP